MSSNPIYRYVERQTNDEAAKMSEAAAQQARYKRRTYVVDRGFQFKYTMMITVFGTGIAALLGWFLYDSIRESTEIANMMAEFPELQMQIQERDAQKMLIIGLGVTAICLWLVIWGIVMTHRVAGPMFIMTRYVRQLGAGEYPSLRPLRKNDELREFFDAFKTMLDTLSDHDRKDLEELRAVAKKLDDLSARAAKGESNADLSRELRSLVEPLRSVASHKAKRLKLPNF